MKERPILFSAPMVRAILSGTKTQTRRALKVQPIDILPMLGDKAGVEWIGHMQNDPPRGTVFRCRHGKAGDWLWVRETFRICGEGKSDKLNMFSRDDVQYRADRDESYIGPYHPSIHMPRRLSRINLEIVSVRVERLNDISELDAMAEGAEPLLVPPDGGSCPHVEGFRDLWEKINGAGSWAVNPWVWVVEFKRV